MSWSRPDRADGSSRLERPDLFNVHELMGEMEAAMRRAAAERIYLLGSGGKA